MSRFSLGRGVKDSKVYATISFGGPGELARKLNRLDVPGEGWWSAHSFAPDPDTRQAHRTSATWCAACAVVLDLDAHRRGEDMPWDTDDVSRALLARAEATVAASYATAWHPTPKGLRLVYVFPVEATDPALYRRAAQGAAALARDWLKTSGLLYDPAHLQDSGLDVDSKCTQDLARLMYLPKCIAKSKRREATVHVLNPEPIDPETLATYAPAPPPPKPPNPAADKLAKAIAEWNAANQDAYGHPWPANESGCPVCDGSRGFKRMPSNSQRWCCWSESHGQTKVGRPSSDGTFWSGTAIDIAIHERGLANVYELLREDGFWEDEPAQTGGWRR